MKKTILVLLALLLIVSTTALLVACGQLDQDPCANGHKWDEGTVTLEPTCTAEGTLIKRCKICGVSQEETLAKIEHTWGEPVVEQAPTCTTPGKGSVKCTVCGEENNSYEIPTIAHVVDTSSLHAAVEPTCHSTGMVEYYECTMCHDAVKLDAEGNVLDDEQLIVAKTEHNYDNGVVTKAPDCTNPGTMTFTCQNNGCGETYESQVAPTGHNYDNGVVTKAPDCTNPGTKKFTCQNDGCEEYYERQLDAVGHVYGPRVDEVPATCTSEGKREYYVCNVCGLFFVDENGSKVQVEESKLTIAQKDHQLDPIAKVEPTCTKEGYEAYWQCKVCNQLFSDPQGEQPIDEPEEIGKTAHQLESFGGKAPTCTEVGYEAGTRCSVCKLVIEQPKQIPALGHDYRINANKGENGWQWTEEHNAATLYIICQHENCPNKEVSVTAEVSSEVIDADNTRYTAIARHGDSSWQTSVVVNSKHTEHRWVAAHWKWADDFSSVTLQLRCEVGNELDEQQGEISSVVTQPADCTNAGIKTYTATVNYGGSTFTDTETEVLKALGHQKGEFHQGKPAECGVPGTKAYYDCANDCGSKLDEDGNVLDSIEIDALEHVSDEKLHTDEANRTHYNECTLCHERLNETACSGLEVWKSDDNHHWHECETCHQHYDETEHTFTGWKHNDGATTHTGTCVCGKTHTETCSNTTTTCPDCGHVYGDGKEEIIVHFHMPTTWNDDNLKFYVYIEGGDVLTNAFPGNDGWVAEEGEYAGWYKFTFRVPTGHVGTDLYVIPTDKENDVGHQTGNMLVKANEIWISKYYIEVHTSLDDALAEENQQLPTSNDYFITGCFQGSGTAGFTSDTKDWNRVFTSDNEWTLESDFSAGDTFRVRKNVDDWNTANTNFDYSKVVLPITGEPGVNINGLIKDDGTNDHNVKITRNCHLKITFNPTDKKIKIHVVSADELSDTPTEKYYLIGDSSDLGSWDNNLTTNLLMWDGSNFTIEKTLKKGNEFKICLGNWVASIGFDAVNSVTKTSDFVGSVAQGFFGKNDDGNIIVKYDCTVKLIVNRDFDRIDVEVIDATGLARDDEVPEGCDPIVVKFGSNTVTIYLKDVNGNPVDKARFSNFVLYTYGNGDAFGAWDNGNTTEGKLASTMTGSTSTVPEGWVFRWGSSFNTQTENIENVISAGKTYLVELVAKGSGNCRVTELHIAHTHEWTVEWGEWSAYDGSNLPTISAKLKCSCGEEIEENVNVNVAEKPDSRTDSTCTMQGHVTFTATATCEGYEISDSNTTEKQFELPLGDHIYTLEEAGARWSWSDDHLATLHLVCANCYKQTLDVQFAADAATYTDVVVEEATCQYPAKANKQITVTLEQLQAALNNLESKPSLAQNIAESFPDGSITNKDEAHSYDFGNVGAHTYNNKNYQYVGNLQHQQVCDNCGKPTGKTSNCTFGYDSQFESNHCTVCNQTFKQTEILDAIKRGNLKPTSTDKFFFKGIVYDKKTGTNKTGVWYNIWFYVDNNKDYGFEAYGVSLNGKVAYDNIYNGAEVIVSGTGDNLMYDLEHAHGFEFYETNGKNICKVESYTNKPYTVSTSDNSQDISGSKLEITLTDGEGNVIDTNKTYNTGTLVKVKVTVSGAKVVSVTVGDKELSYDADEGVYAFYVEGPSEIIVTIGGINVPSEKNTVEIVVADYATENSWKTSAGNSRTQYEKIVAQGVANITVAADGKMSGSYYSNGWRLYSSENSQLIIAGTNAQIVSVIIEYGRSGACLNYNSEEYKSGTTHLLTAEEIQTNSVTFDVVKTGSNSGNLNTTKITITYKYTTNHQFGEWIPASEPSCETSGIVGHYECTNPDHIACRGKYFDAEGNVIENPEISAKGHGWNKGFETIEKQDSTCTEKGHVAYYKCLDCGQLFSDEGHMHKIDIGDVEEIPAKGHSWKIDESQGENGWTWDGSTPTLHLVCGNDPEHIHAIELTSSEGDKVGATCQSNSFTTYNVSITVDELKAKLPQPEIDKLVDITETLTAQTVVEGDDRLEHNFTGTPVHKEGSDPSVHVYTCTTCQGDEKKTKEEPCNQNKVGSNSEKHWKECSACGHAAEDTRGDHSFDESGNCQFDGCPVKSQNVWVRFGDGNETPFKSFEDAVKFIDEQQDTDSVSITLLADIQEDSLALPQTNTKDVNIILNGHTLTVTNEIVLTAGNLTITGTSSTLNANIKVQSGESLMLTDFTLNGEVVYANGIANLEIQETVQGKYTFRLEGVQCDQLASKVIINGETLSAHKLTYSQLDGEQQATKHHVECSICSYEKDKEHSLQYSNKTDATHDVICTDNCGYSASGVTHTFGEYTEVDDTFHKHQCTACEHIVQETHTYNENNITEHDDAGHTVQCDTCTHTKTEDHATLLAKVAWQSCGDSDLQHHQKTCPTCQQVIKEAHDFGTGEYGSATRHDCKCGEKLCQSVSVNLEFTSSNYANTANTVEDDGYVSKDGYQVTIEFRKGGNSQYSGRVDKTNIVLYGKNTMKIIAPTGTKLKEITITFTTIKELSASVGTYNTVSHKWTGLAESVTFQNTTTAQAKFSKLSITLEGEPADESHLWEKGETTPGSCKGKGTHEQTTYTCLRCGKTKTEEGAIPDHVWGDQYNWDESSNGHYRTCTKCSAREDVTSCKNTTVWESNETQHRKYCTECKHDYVAWTDHDKTYSMVDETYHKQYCQCDYKGFQDEEHIPKEGPCTAPGCTFGAKTFTVDGLGVENWEEVEGKVNAATGKIEITLNKDLTMETLSLGSTNASVEIIFNLGGNTLTITDIVSFGDIDVEGISGKVIVKNGTIKAAESALNLLAVSGNVTLDNVTLDGTNLTDIGVLISAQTSATELSITNASKLNANGKVILSMAGTDAGSVTVTIGADTEISKGTISYDYDSTQLENGRSKVAKLIIVAGCDASQITWDLNGKSCDTANITIGREPISHTYSEKPTSKDDTHHTGLCAICGTSFDEEHYGMEDDNTCDGCGYEKKVETKWAKLVKATDLQVGDQLILAYETNAMGAQSGSYRTKVDNGITLSADGTTIEKVASSVALITLKKGSADGTFAMQVSDGYLSHSSGNSVDTVTLEEVNSAASWKFYAESGVIYIQNAATTDYKLQYNASSPRFACYTTNQVKPTIWVYAGGGYVIEGGGTQPDPGPNPGGDETITTVTINCSSITDVADFTEGGIHITSDQNGGSSAPAKSSSQFRLYAKNTITITAPSGKKLISVEFTCSTANYCLNLTVTSGGGSYTKNSNKGTWTGDTNSVTLKAPDSGAHRIQTIVVKYK